MNSIQGNKQKLLLEALSCIAGIMLATSSVLAQDETNRTEKALTQLGIESIHILGGFRNPVIRWNSVINLAIVGDTDPTTMAQITSVFNEISLLSGIRYTRVGHAYTEPERYLKAIGDSPDHDLTLCDTTKSTQCANFVVLVISQELMHKVAVSLPLRPVFQQASARKDNIYCFFSPNVASNLEIKQSIVWVRSNLEEPLLNTCLQEEIYQSFGLFNDFSDSHYFSFNNIVAPKKITPFDKQLLTSLYDAAFRSGTSTEAVAQQLIDYCRATC